MVPNNIQITIIIIMILKYSAILIKIISNWVNNKIYMINNNIKMMIRLFVRKFRIINNPQKI